MDFLEILKDNIIFEGDLRQYMLCKDIDEQYFEPMTFTGILKNFYGVLRIIGRTYFT